MATLRRWTRDWWLDIVALSWSVWALWAIAGVVGAVAMLLAAAHVWWLDNWVCGAALTLAFCCGSLSKQASVRRRREAIEDAIHTCEVASRFGGDPYKESPGVARARAAAAELRALLEEVGP